MKLKHAPKIVKLLVRQKVKFRRFDRRERRDLSERWLKAFAKNVKKQTGVYIYSGLRWHGYSYEIEKCLKGDEAKAEYFRQEIAKFYVFEDNFEHSFECESSNYPHFSSKGEDIYVCPHNLSWSMAFTHEEPELGPYFAEREK